MRTSRLATIAAIAGLILASCGDDDSASDAGGESGTGDTETQAGGDLDRDAVLRYGYYITLSTFDPHLASGSNDNTWLYPAYDRLVHTDVDAEPEPGLAESWEFSDDGSYLEMQLRQDVVFHDGEPFDADAVRANIERAQTHEQSALVSTLEHVESVEVVDEHTVRFHTSYPDASLPLVLSDRAGAMISPAAFDNPDLHVMPVGAGAFRVTQYLPDDRAVYERFDDYWDVDTVDLGGLEIIALVDETTRLNGLRSGQIDAAEIDPGQVGQAESAGLNIKTAPDVSFGLLQFHSALREEFADERVRRAINHAIDRDAIAEGIFRGYASPAVQVFPEGYFAHSPDILDDYFEYDPDRARELLDEAGYPDGFSFEIVTTTTPLRLRTTEAIQQDLAEIGLDVSIRQIEGGGPFLDLVYGQASAESWMLAWGGRADPSLTASLLFGADSYNNPSGLSSNRVEDLIAESVSVFDDDERQQILQELSEAIVEDVLDVVVLYFPEKIAVYNDRVVGLEIWTVGRPEFRGVGMTAG